MNEGSTSLTTQGKGAKAGASGWLGGTLGSPKGSWGRANKGSGVEEVGEVKTARSCRTKEKAGPNLHQMMQLPTQANKVFEYYLPIP